MKRIFTLAFLLFGNFTFLFAQSTAHKKSSEVNFNGQWKGGFDETTYGYSGLGGSHLTYVLELQTEGTRVSGYSYTYFNEFGKKYYTICRLTGLLNRVTNEITVTEVERTKFNTPPDFINCFQTHRLHYEKEGDDTEVLRGTWIPAPNQGNGCGKGTTLLARRIVNKLPMGIKPNKKNEIAKAPQKKAAPKKPLVTPKKTPGAIAKRNPPPKKLSTIIKDTPIGEKPITSPEIKNITAAPKKRFENRRKDIVKTITINQPTFRLDFYDNGEIDGDSISVFYNEKLVLSHKKLTDKPISLTLTLEPNTRENIVTMYAENLGTIPPNTAVMIVTDGNKRYEVRITSDTEKSGSVVFVHGEE
ncbi:MAG TPA: hypothetical protein VGW31_15460 [Hanamia sp.]|nr:hypothetical protein [Hanamia sp.]